MGAPDRLRVLLLAQWYEPVIGGEETHVRSLAHELAARGHSVSVVALSHPDRPAEYADGPVVVHRVRAATQRLPGLFSDAVRQSAPPFPDPGVTTALRRILDRERPHIVHAHNWMVYSYLPLHRPSVPLVLTLHDHSQVCAKKVLLFEGRACAGPAPMKCARCTAEHYGVVKGPVTLAGLWGMGPLLRRQADSFVAVSRSVARSAGMRPGHPRVSVIPNFLTAGSFAEHAAPPGLPDRPFLMFAGSLSRIKGVETLLDAYVALDGATRPPLVMVGYRGTESIASLADPPAGVTIITDQPHGAVAAAWDRSLLALVPSIVPESFGLVALEAMARGRPVVASNIGGLAEVLSHDSGILVAPGDPAALSSAIARLLADRPLRERLGAGARERSKEFTADRVIPRIEALYRELVSRRRRPPLAATDCAARQPAATIETSR